VRYEASTKPGELVYPVNYTVWIPPGVKLLRGVIVHQHGCGEGSCKSGLTPPAPTNVRVIGNELTWDAEADLESGLAGFIIERDGEFLANVPDQGKNPFGRPLFQNLQYSDTPTQPLVPMRYIDKQAVASKKHIYRVIAVNTVRLKSPPAGSFCRSRK
jgi:hypothetical protein